ncbi:MAG TPA: FtsX-like permease family protein [Caulobacteraceae bacterium]|jgi:putative ABC transport system permease protein
MSFFRQIWTVTLLSLEGLPARWRPSLVLIVGVAGAVAATLSLLALGASLRSMALGHIDPDLAIVFSGGAAGESTSDLSPAEVALIVQAPGVRLDAAGKPMADGEAVILMDVVRKKSGVTDRINLRGLGPEGLAMDKQFHLTSGRMFRPGADELIVGRKAEGEYAGLDIGSRIALRGVAWTVVGTFEDGGGIGEAEMMTDAPTELSAFARSDYQSVIAKLDRPGDFARFNDALTSNPQLSVVARPYLAYVSVQVRGLTAVLNFVAYFVGVVMALGAVFAAVNTLYSAVDARRREIATLRAIGFSGFAVLVSVVGEGVALALPGALLGGLLAWALINGRQADVSGLAYSLAVSPGELVFGLVAAVVVALIGAALPALKAARLPVAEALRAT